MISRTPYCLYPVGLLIAILIWSCGGGPQRDAAPALVPAETSPTEVVVGTTADSVQHQPIADRNINPDDTAARRILLVGDSQAGGIMYPLNDYCLHNGHEIAAALVWFSASDRTLAGSDTLTRLIEKYRPDYILVVIGLNQVFQTQHAGSRAAVKKVISAFGGIPYAWIGPANWVEDKGINNLYAEATEPKTFFRSADLPLERASDGRHPNMKGYRQWMDSVAGWLSHSARWPIRMERPEKRNRSNTFPLIMLNAAKQPKKDAGAQPPADSVSRVSGSSGH